VGGLLFLLPLFPPETRGESLAGSAAIVVLLALLALWQGMPRLGASALAAAFACAWPVARAAVAPGAAVEPLAIWLLAGAAGVSARSFARSLGRSGTVLLALAASGAIAGAHAVYQVGFGLEAAARAVAEGRIAVADREVVLARLAEGRAYGAFATPASLGGFLVLCLPVTVGLAMERKGAARAALLFAAALQGAGLLASRSATAAGALVVSLVVDLARRRGRLAAGAVFLAAGLAAAVFASRSGELFSLSRPDSPFLLRARNFRIACEIAREFPWLGAGPGGYAELFPGFRREGDNESRHAHNLLLELVAELGIPAGGLLACAVYGLFAGPLFFARSRPDGARRGVEAGLSALALQNLGDFSLFYPSLLWAGAIVRGMTARGERSEKALEAGIGLAAPVVVAAAGAAVVAGLGGLSWNARVEARQAAAANEPDRAAALARRAFRLAPWNPDASLFYAQALARLEGGGSKETLLEEALRAADAAVAGSPVRPGARDTRAAWRLRAGDLPGAYADWAEAARLYPIRKEYAARRDEIERKLPGRSGAERP